MDMTFFTWEILGTFAGAVTAVGLITQMVKGLPVVKSIPTQLVSWVLALVVLNLAHAFDGTLSAQSAVLSLFNAALVSLSANGGHDAVKRIWDSVKGSGANETGGDGR